MPCTDWDVRSIYMDESLSLDYVKNVISFMRMHWEAAMWPQINEVASQIRIVRFLAAYTMTTGDS